MIHREMGGNLGAKTAKCSRIRVGLGVLWDAGRKLEGLGVPCGTSRPSNRLVLEFYWAMLLVMQAFRGSSSCAKAETNTGIMPVPEKTTSRAVTTTGTCTLPTAMPYMSCFVWVSKACCVLARKRCLRRGGPKTHEEGRSTAAARTQLPPALDFQFVRHSLSSLYCHSIPCTNHQVHWNDLSGLSTASCMRYSGMAAS